MVALLLMVRLLNKYSRDEFDSDGAECRLHLNAAVVVR